MKKILITGVSGFVSKHFIEYLETLEDSFEILGIDVFEPVFRVKSSKIRFEYKIIDLLNLSEIENVIFEFKPEYVLHLASYSSVAFSWKNPVLSFQNNVNIFLNLVETIRKLSLKTRILSIGSSEEYGNMNHTSEPISEEVVLDPISPYAVARVSQESLSKVYAQGYGVDIVMTRSFNHIGPGQKDIFVLSSFAKQFANMKADDSLSRVFITGDLSIVRDFLDVRDVVRAYYGLLLKGRSGEVYNVCSGKGCSLEVIVDKLQIISGINVEKKVDPKLIRPNDNRIIIGSHKKITEELGWLPSYTMEESLKDLIAYWS